MNLVLPVFYTLLQLFVLALIGFALVRLLKYPRRFFRHLSAFTANIALPVYFFVSVSRTDPADVAAGWIFLPASVAVIAAGVAFGWVSSRLCGLDVDERRAAMGLAAFGNSGYVPLTLMEIFPLTLPAVAGMFPARTASLYVGIYLLVYSPALWTLGNYLVTGSGKKLRIGDLVTPPFLGILSGLAVVLLGLQGVLLRPDLPFLHVYKALERIAALTIPLVMVSVGALLAGLGLRGGGKVGHWKAALSVAAVRLLLLPLAFLGVYFLFLKRIGLTPVQQWVLFLETMVPPATNFSVMASRSARNEDLVSVTLLATYLLYLVALPAGLVAFLRLVP